MTQEFYNGLLVLIFFSIIFLLFGYSIGHMHGYNQNPNKPKNRHDIKTQIKNLIDKL